MRNTDTDDSRPARVLRIAEVAPPDESVPPAAYGGTERVVHELVRGLVARGHTVTTFASGDSQVPGRHVVTVPEALRSSGGLATRLPWVVASLDAVVRAAEQGEFDVIHTHLDLLGVLAAAAADVPVVATFHGRLDHPAYGPVLRSARAHLVGISAHQVSMRPEADWSVVHNGLTLDEAPFERRRDDALVFVGRITPEKGALVAVEAARLSGRPLRIIAKEPGLPIEREYLEDVFLPSIRDDDRVELLGELVGPDRDHVVASSHALLMPSAWPEPFGLVAIEALACGTPVIAHRSGGIPEIVREGVDGFFGDDALHMANLVGRVDELDREAVRADAIDRFSARRMTLGYEKVMLAAVADAEAQRPRAMRSRESTTVDGSRGPTADGSSGTTTWDPAGNGAGVEPGALSVRARG